MKKRIVLFLALIFSVVLPLECFAMVAQSESYYVCDDAGVLSGELEDRLVALNAQLESQCKGAQLVVVSVEYMDGLYADEYAYALMNDWGVGSATEDNGTLLLFATRENRGWLAVGQGIYRSFGEDAAEHYLDQYFWDQYDRGNYEKGVDQLTQALSSWYAKYYGASLSGSGSTGGNGSVYATNPAPASGSRTDGTLLLLLLIVLFLVLSRSGRRGFAQGLFYRPRSGLLNYLFWNSIFRSNNNNNHRPPRSGGGFGGGSGFGGGGFGGGMGHGGGGHSGGGGGRR